MLTDRQGLRRNATWIILISLLIPSSISAAIDVDVRLNNGGFVSFDHFRAELYLNNQGAAVQDAKIFGILEIFGEYYFWPAFTQEIGYMETAVLEGKATVVFLEFDFPQIDDFIPFGPINFLGAWFLNESCYGFDFEEFWLDSEHKWTPIPTPTETPANTPTDTPLPADTPTSTPTYTAIPTNTATMTPTSPGPVSVGKMISISSGSFTQGSPLTEPCRWNNEAQFIHSLTRNLSVMETEVTRQMWTDLQAVQTTLPGDPSNTIYSPTMSHPVQENTWYEAVLFANLLSVQNGYTQCYYTNADCMTPITSANYTTGPFFCYFNADGYRLPTEGEWEYFTRAGTTGPFSCDESLYASFNCNTCTAGTHPKLELYCVYCANNPGATAVAGSKLANPWGLKDVHGNVIEWCWDWGGTYPTGLATDYTGLTSGSWRVVRGGGWLNHATTCHSAVRFASTPGWRERNAGFRLVRTIN